MTVRVLQGDYLEVLPTLAEGSVDAVITDPPYCSGAISEAHRTRAPGQGLRSENFRRFGWFVGDNMGTAGLAWLLRSLAVQCQRVVKRTGSLLLFCDWRMLPTLGPAVESAGLRYQGLIVWDKGSMGLGNGFRKQHELIMHFTFGAPKYHDASVGNVIRCSRVRAADRYHQTEKPVGLLAKLVAVTTPPGGAVLDPFAGSGTTGLACLQEGRDAILIEREPAYVEIIRRRLDAERQKAPLFQEVP